MPRHVHDASRGGHFRLTSVSRTPRRPYSRTGLNALKAKVKLRGLAAIDLRTSAARALLAWRRDLTDDLGGDGVLSTQERAIIDLAASASTIQAVPTTTMPTRWL